MLFDAASADRFANELRPLAEDEGVFLDFPFANSLVLLTLPFFGEPCGDSPRLPCCFDPFEVEPGFLVPIFCFGAVLVPVVSLPAAGLFKLLLPTFTIVSMPVLSIAYTFRLVLEGGKMRGSDA